MKLDQLFASLRNRGEEPKKSAEWKHIEYFDPLWEERVATLARMIKNKGRVVDFGCGKQYLRKYLPPESQYIPVDYVSRTPDTIVADFNKLPYPKIDGDIAFISGFLEYVEDAPGFIKHISGLSFREIVMSYCTVEAINNMEERIGLGWKCHLGLHDLLGGFLESFTLHEIGCISRNPTLRFERKT